jgi:RNA polymerase sigma-70 factor (ECF subfamily)
MMETRMATAMRGNARSQPVNEAVPGTGPDGDVALVRAAQVDLRAFAPLYERYAPIVYHYCLRRLSHAEVAADATSLVFTRAVAALPRFRPDPGREGSTFRSWLFTIAHNVVVDQHRRHRPTTSLDEPGTIDTIGATLVSPYVTPEEHALLQDAADRVHHWLDHLPERQRHIVELRLAGLTGEEIARTLGMSLSAVKSAQFRAYATLRTVISGDQR